jgi:hypothetical protein
VPAEGTTTYAERLDVPLRWWVQGVMLLATFWLAFVVAIPGVLPWVITGALGALLVLAFTSYGGLRLAVRDGHFLAGRARIPLAQLGTAEALDAAGTRLAAGADADTRAFLVLRPYLKRAVRVPVVDPGDPTPYWLVCTRHPEALAAALNTGRTAPPG